MLRLGRTLPGGRGGDPPALAFGQSLAQWPSFPHLGHFSGGGGRSPRGALVVVWVRGRPAWMKSSAASSLVFSLCFRTRRLTSSGMAFISCSFTKMSRMSMASVLSVPAVPAFVQRSARSRNQTASFRGVSPALSLAARKCWRYMYVSSLMLYRRRIGALRVSYTRVESAATAA